MRSITPLAYLWRILSLLVVAGTAHAFQVEAETGTLFKAVVGTSRAGYSGTGYVTGIQENDATVTLTFNVDTAGNYALKFRYAAEFGDKFMRLVVNGANRGEVSLPMSLTWATSQATTVPLVAGMNTVQIQRDWGYYEIDALQVDFVPPAANAYEAETGTLQNVTLSISRPGYSGTGYVTDFTTPTSSVTIPINLPSTGTHQITLRYASPFGDKMTRVFVDDVDRGEWSLPTSTIFASAQGPTLSLTAGPHSVRIESDWGYYDIDRVNIDYVPPTVGTRFEAETGTLANTSVGTSHLGYSGTGYVTGFTSADASVAIPVNLAAPGTYQVHLLASAPFGDKRTRIFINGADQGEIALTATTEWQDFVGPIVFLPAGPSTVTFVNDWGYYEVDRIDLVHVDVPPFNIDPMPSDPWASPEAVMLYRYLRDSFGKTTLSGQTEDPFADRPNGGINRILAVTGKLPAMRNQDFLATSAVGGWNDGTTDRALEWGRTNGGIITAQWHWFAPVGGRAFYTADTTFDVTKAIDPSQPEYALAIADIDAVARQIGRMAANRVPIIFRPLHEAEGGWFWWGAKGPGPAIALYKIMYDRFTRYHGLHNILWVWNSVNPAWYPGNDIVDFVSADVYKSPHDYSVTPSLFLNLANLGSQRKMVAMAENGVVPSPQMMQDAGAVYSWYATWHTSFVRDETYTTDAVLRSVYDSPYVITLDELPNLRPPTAVTLFQSAIYSGAAAELPQGDYTAQALTTRGLSGGAITSLRVPRGWRITVYEGDNYTGAARTLTSDTPSLEQAGFNGPVGSVRVRRG